MDIHEALSREAQEAIVINNLKEDLAIAQENFRRLLSGHWTGESSEKKLKRRIKALEVIIEFYS